MADRITLAFGADVDEVVRGTDQISQSLDDTTRKLEDVGTAGEEAGQSTSDGLDRAAQSGSDASDIFDGAGTKLLGIAGIAGGVGGAVTSAIGGAVDFVKGKIDEQIKAAAELRQNLVGAYKDAASEGRAYLEFAQIIAASNEILFDPAKRAAAIKDAATIGVDANTYIAAQAGDYNALKVVIEAAHQAEDARRQAGSDGSKSSQADTLQDIQGIKDVITKSEQLLGVHKENQAAAAQAAQISAQLSQEERAQIQQTADADQSRYEGVAANIAKLKGQKVQVPVEFDVNSSSLDSYLRDLRNRHIPIVADVVDHRYGRTVP